MNKCYWSAGRMADAIRSRELSSLEAVDLCIERIEHYDDELNAVCVRRFDPARDEARSADAAVARGDELGPLHGVPITVKEAFDVIGTPTTWGFPERGEHRAQSDSEVVRRLCDAGAVVIGKTNVPPALADWQSANPLYGRTCNPWDVERTPGGSSGGAAAALAAGYAFLEAGSDIGGSLRNPAHFCGVCAHKPTFGIVSLCGHSVGDPERPSDILVGGPMARFVADLELGLNLIAGPGPRDAKAWALRLPATRPSRLGDCRIAVVLEEPVCRVAESVKGAIRRMGEACAEAGAAVDFEAELPFDTRYVHELYIQLLRGAMAASLSA